MSRVFGFHNQLEVGQAGENLFIASYKDLGAAKTDGRKTDFILETKESVELKTDTYPMIKTENFFMERFSNADKGTEGGPWRAAQDKVDYFVYLFLSDKTFFWFRSADLRDFLDTYVKVFTPKPKIIQNRGWQTIGFAIPRGVCSQLCFRQNSF